MEYPIETRLRVLEYIADRRHRNFKARTMAGQLDIGGHQVPHLLNPYVKMGIIKTGGNENYDRYVVDTERAQEELEKLKGEYNLT